MIDWKKIQKVCKGGSICWKCKGGCSWEKEFKPVDDWVADPKPMVSEYSRQLVDSYIVRECPCFAEMREGESIDNDGYEISRSEVARRMGKVLAMPNYSRIGYEFYVYNYGLNECKEILNLMYPGVDFEEDPKGVVHWYEFGVV